MTNEPGMYFRINKKIASPPLSPFAGERRKLGTGNSKLGNRSTVIPRSRQRPRNLALRFFGTNSARCFARYTPESPERDPSSSADGSGWQIK